MIEELGKIMLMVLVIIVRIMTPKTITTWKLKGLSDLSTAMDSIVYPDENL